MRHPSWIVEVGLKRQERQYPLEYSFFSRAGSFPHRFSLATGEFPGLCQGQDFIRCLTGVFPLFISFPPCLSVVINRLPGIQ